MLSVAAGFLGMGYKRLAYSLEVAEEVAARHEGIHNPSQLLQTCILIKQSHRGQQIFMRRHGGCHICFVLQILSGCNYILVTLHMTAE